MRVTARNFRPFAKNTVIGFADVELTDLGLKLFGWGVHRKDGEFWLSPPGRRYVDAQGQSQWGALAEFTDKDKRAAFQREAVTALRRLLEPGRTAAPPTRTAAAPHVGDLNDEMPF
jgi:hypothetical protein